MTTLPPDNCNDAAGILDSLDDLICRLSPLGEIVYLNAACCRYFNTRPELAVGQKLPAFLSPERCADIMKVVYQLTPQNPGAVVESPWRTPSGQAGWLRWLLKGLFDSRGQLSGVQMVGQDISECKQGQLDALQRSRQLEALHVATRALLSTLELDTLLGQILDAALSAIPAAEKGMIHLLSGITTGQLEMRASAGYTDPRIQKFGIPGARGYVARAVRESQPCLILDSQTDPAVRYHSPSAEVRAVQSAIVAPLILNGDTIGAISLDSTRRGAFTDADLQLLVNFADVASMAIHNAQLHAEVQKMAITDALTGLYNRRGFTELGRREVQRALRFERPLTAIMADIDHFKYINDTYGHGVGDLVLKAIAVRCSSNVRAVDIVGRYGGEEFVILLPETDMFTAVNVAERLRQRVCELPIMAGNVAVNVSISLGVARVSTETPDLEALLSRADAALYNAKQKGRNRVEI